MATSLFSNLLYNNSNGSSNDTDVRDKNALSDGERQQIVSLLKASMKCVEEGTCDAVIYQTMGALHQYTAMCAGLLSSNTLNAASQTQERQRPAFRENSSESSDHEDTLAYGWIEELAVVDGASDVTWNSVLALLVQKEKDDEPCLWITKEVIATTHDDSDDNDNADDDRDENNIRRSQPSTELETLHSIPLRRRLRSCAYQNFYGDHRVVLELKRYAKKSKSQIVLRCPSQSTAKAWVECLSKAKKKPLTTHANIEVEMVDPSPSNEFNDDDDDRQHIVNVIDSEDDEDDYGIPDEDQMELPTSPKRLAEVLQATEDRKRAVKIAEKKRLESFEKERQAQLEAMQRQEKLNAKLEEEKRQQEKLAAMARQKKEALERKQQEETQQKRLAAIEKNVETIAKVTTKSSTAAVTTKPTKFKPMTAAEKQQQRMEREIAARKRAEEERRRIEIEYEQQKKERVEQRRRDLEAKRKLAREEQKRKEQLQKQRFLESEQRKEAMKAAAMKSPPKKVSKGVFSTPSAAKEEKGNLWASLNKHMSAFETADEERKKREAEKREQEKAKVEQEEEDPEVVRKRIAEEARQRQLQEEVGKKSKDANYLNGGYRLPEVSPTTNRPSVMNGWKQQPRGMSSQATISPITSQHNRTAAASISPPASGNYATQSTNAVPSVPPLSHPHTQSWNNVQQPPFTQQQQPQHAQFQRPPPTTGGQFNANAQVQRPQQSTQSTAGSFTPMHQAQTIPTTTAPKPAQVPPKPPPSQNSSEEFSGSELKKNVLVQWGLQPPAMQVLKPVDQLLCSIHVVFPPSFGVPSHEYFRGWTAISRTELVTNGILDEAKLKKMVRKVRFFLHPDKLPHDLTEEQSFLCKLLWDVTNDAFEEYKKSKEDLDWM